jgi:hypothetical protein
MEREFGEPASLVTTVFEVQLLGGALAPHQCPHRWCPPVLGGAGDAGDVGEVGEVAAVPDWHPGVTNPEGRVTLQSHCG